MHLSTCVDTPEVGVQPPAVLTAERHPASVSYPVPPEESLPHPHPKLQLLPLPDGLAGPLVLPPVLWNLGGHARMLILRKTRTSNRMLNANTQNEETAKASVWVGSSSSGAPGEGSEEPEGHRRTGPRPQPLPAACDTAQKCRAPRRVYEQNLEGNHPPPKGR